LPLLFAACVGCAKPQGVNHPGQHASQTPAIGSVQPGYGVMPLGRWQPGCNCIAKIVNTIL
jgi:hypothetical protein